MQTFLPYPSFIQSAVCLDMRRLGKQRIETKQILEILLAEKDSKAWKNHPAVLMWKNYETALCNYGLAICSEWIIRGYKDTLRPFFVKKLKEVPEFKAPDWLNNPKFCSSHRQTLLFKNFDWYKNFGWSEQPEYKYWWPTKDL